MTPKAKKPKKAKKAAKAPVYFWFEGGTVTELVRRIQEIGAENVRFEVHPEGNTNCHLQVIDKRGTVARLVALDEAHVCPPSCS